MNSESKMSAWAIVLMLAAPFTCQAMPMTLVNLDQGSGQGLDDPTPVQPVGGNPGRTLGAQRRAAYEFALAQWGAVLQGTVPTEVSASFTALGCSSQSAVVGAAGATAVYNNFANVRPAVLYPSALANTLAGRRLDEQPHGVDILTRFNKDLGTPGCLEGRGWYLGVDGHTPGGQINFINVVMHELGHGLGAAGALDMTTGALGFGRGLTDAYTRHTRDVTSERPLDAPALTDADRLRILKSPGRVVWHGLAVRRDAALLLEQADRDRLAGADARGRPQLYTPLVLARGSTFAHFDTTLRPQPLMAPFIGDDLQADITLDLTPALMADIGWRLDTATARLDGCDTQVPVVAAGGLIPGANLLARQQLCRVAFAGNREGQQSCVLEHAYVLNDAKAISAAQLNRVRQCLAVPR